MYLFLEYKSSHNWHLTIYIQTWQLRIMFFKQKRNPLFLLSLKNSVTIMKHLYLTQWLIIQAVYLVQRSLMLTMRWKVYGKNIHFFDQEWPWGQGDNSNLSCFPLTITKNGNSNRLSLTYARTHSLNQYYPTFGYWKRCFNRLKLLVKAGQVNLCQPCLLCTSAQKADFFSTSYTFQMIFKLLC